MLYSHMDNFIMVLKILPVLLVPYQNEHAASHVHTDLCAWACAYTARD